MPKETQIEFKDFLKAIKTYANNNFGKLNVVRKRGSGIRFELFKNSNDDTPIEMWVVHEAKYVYTDDLKKTCGNLRITKDEFLKFIK